MSLSDVYDEPIEVSKAQAAIFAAGKMSPASWNEALRAAAAAIKGRKLAGLVGDLAPVEAVYALKGLVEGLGGHVECRVDGAKLPIGNRGVYAGTAKIEDIDDAKFIQMIGTNP